MSRAVLRTHSNGATSVARHQKDLAASRVPSGLRALQSRAARPWGRACTTRRAPVRKGMVTECSVHRKYKLLLPEVMEEKFEIVKEIGKGSFGMVHEVLNRKTGKTYAIKTMKLPRGLRAREKQQAEIDVLSRLGSCLNICMLFEVFQTPGHVHMVMEQCTGGNLQSRLKQEQGGRYSEARVAELMRDILRTVAQCHACNVVHRDIKPENFLFHHLGEGAPLKAIDFGLAIYAPPGTVLTERCGTAHFMAPEVVNKNYGPVADVWSAGVTAYLLLSGRVPFAADQVMDFDNEEVMQQVLKEDLDLESGTWAQVSQGAKDFVRLLLTRDPKRRPAAVQALQHPWVREGGAEAASEESEISSDVVRRLQMYGTFGALKKAALRKLAAKIARSDDPEVDRLSVLFYELLGELPDSDEAEARSSTTLSFQRLRKGIEELALIGGNHLTDAEIWELASQMEGNQAEECSSVWFDVQGSADEAAESQQLVCPDLAFEDVLASLLNWEVVQKREDWRTMVSELFSAMDSNSDGVLDLQELKALLPGEDASDLREMLEMEGCAKDGSIALSDFLEMLRAETAETLELFPTSGSAEY